MAPPEVTFSDLTAHGADFWACCQDSVLKGDIRMGGRFVKTWSHQLHSQEIEAVSIHQKEIAILGDEGTLWALDSQEMEVLREVNGLHEGVT